MAKRRTENTRQAGRDPKSNESKETQFYAGIAATIWQASKVNLRKSITKAGSIGSIIQGRQQENAEQAGNSSGRTQNENDPETAERRNGSNLCRRTVVEIIILQKTAGMAPGNPADQQAERQQAGGGTAGGRPRTHRRPSSSGRQAAGSRQATQAGRQAGETQQRLW